MTKSTKSDEALVTYLNNNTIASLADIKILLGTHSRMTVYRRLNKLGYISSCSHSGKYYSLQQVAKFNQYGLWSYESVLFSKYGTLKRTLSSLVGQSACGYTALELKEILQIKVEDALLELKNAKVIKREKISGVYVYFSSASNCAKKQKITRANNIEYQDGLEMRPDILMNELKAALIIFYSTLNEKQRRFYAGFESLKLGHGGDTQIAELLNIDKRTVAKGRKELLKGEVDLDIIRKTGGGRKQIKKKPLT